MKINYKHLEAVDFSQFVKTRDGEVKLGEKISESIVSETEFVIIGIPEDIGIRANMGKAGASAGFSAFLSYFLNTQHNDFIHSAKIALLGTVQVADLMEKSAIADIAKLRNLCSELDKRVEEALVPLFSSGKKLIIIGGGHNNAYPILKALHLAKKSNVACINIDPHSDCRPLEGRHSGNSFSYAIEEKFLEKYALLAFHENYLSHTMGLFLHLHKNTIFSLSWEQIFLEKKYNLTEALEKTLQSVADLPCGIELDMDAILNMPSSAMSPSGLSLDQARAMLYQMAGSKNFNYLHLPEAAPHLAANGDIICGKALTYLVLDFIKANQNIE